MNKLFISLLMILFFNSCDYYEEDDWIRNNYLTYYNHSQNQNNNNNNNKDTTIINNNSYNVVVNNDTLTVNVSDYLITNNHDTIIFRVVDTCKINNYDTLIISNIDTFKVTVKNDFLIYDSNKYNNEYYNNYIDSIKKAFQLYVKTDDFSNVYNNQNVDNDSEDDYLDRYIDSLKNLYNDTTYFSNPYQINFWINGELIDSQKYNIEDTVLITDFGLHKLGMKLYWQGFKQNGFWSYYKVGNYYTFNQDIEMRGYFDYGIYMSELSDYLEEIKNSDYFYERTISILDASNNSFDSIKNFLNELSNIKIKLILNGNFNKIPNNAFGSGYNNNNSIVSVEINTGSNIGKEAFAGLKSLEYVKLPSNLREIGEKAFYECSDLDEITIPSSISKIGDNAFTDCRDLSKVYMEGAPPTLNNSNAFNTGTKTTIFVKKTYLEKYQKANYWKSLNIKVK
ncbi:MAG: leucine-rich repeat domain-containing protein [Bacteroidales bacterium]|nr:leucine-rich repeat domain-containing protein [Bacteroidales bacterium]